MHLNPSQYARALYDALMSVAPEKHDLVIDRFATILSEYGQLGLLPEIEREFLEYEKLQAGAIPVKITTARKDGHEKDLIAKLHEVIGQDISLKQSIDEGLVGGVVIETDDERIDASVAGQLKRLNRSMKTGTHDDK